MSLESCVVERGVLLVGVVNLPFRFSEGDISVAGAFCRRLRGDGRWR